MGKYWQGWEKIRPILGAQSPQGYRNKGIFAVQKQGQEIKLGFYQKKSRQLAGNGCSSLFSLAVNGLIQALSFWLTEHEVTVGPEGLHHVMIRESRTTGHLIIVLISSGAKPQWLAEFLQTFVPVEQKDLPPCARKTKQLLSGIGWLAAPDKQGPVISGKPETLWGKLVLVEQLGHIKYGISAESFFQVNTEQAKTLYDQVVQMAGLTGQEHVWDIYCGTGTIGLSGQICVRNRVRGQSSQGWTSQCPDQ
jgi:23S rRNA (uracil1939-C5)-methyltransferase